MAAIEGKGKSGAVRALVTGGAGFIGANFVHHLMAQEGYEVTVLDKLTYAGNLANLEPVKADPRFRFVQGDICDPAVVRALAAECDAIVNFAAETHVDRSIDDAGSFVKTDTYGVYVLLEAARERGVQRFVQISTDEVYGEAGERACGEESPLMPASPYAASKAGGDRIAFSYFVTHRLPVVITRCSNNYGPYQYPEKMIPLFVTNALEEKELPVYGTGRNTRDWIHVTDHCRALSLLLRAENVEGEVFNIGTGEELTILQIAEQILDATGRGRDSMRLVADRPGHIRRHAVETGKIRRRLGWSPQWRFEAGLPDTVDWYRRHGEWWRPIKDGSFREYYKTHYEDRLKGAKPA